MPEDPLQLLLRSADAAPTEPTRLFAPDSLLAAARRKRRRRIAMRSTAATAAIAALLAAPLLIPRSNQPELATNSPSKQPHIPTPHLASVDVDVASEPVPDYALELAQLEQAAAMQSEILRRVLADEETEAAADELRALPTLSDADLLRAETARSAALSLQYATIAEQELHDLETARREYQRVAERFPGTEWAEVAQVSLERLKPINPQAL